jgi:hypothetical protein
MRYFVLVFFVLYEMLFLNAQTNDLLTRFERTDGKETSRYDETIRYCKQLDDVSPFITFSSFGKSAQGRELPMMILDLDGLSDPEAIRSTGRLILMIQACIHPGESEGKDAGMMLFRDLALHRLSEKKSFIIHSESREDYLLNNISILFIPIFNVDGHERFGPYNRINQNGPEEMGWRVTANNLNLNRDYLKTETPEMRQWLILFDQWLPDFFIDIHTTDGADYQYVLTYMMEIYGDMDPGITHWSKEVFVPNMSNAMNESGYPVFSYVTFRKWHDPRSGLITQVAPPMLSQGYTSLRNRPSLLIETHMLKPYKERVEATFQCLLISMTILAGERQKLMEITAKADDFVCSDQFLKEPFPLHFSTLMNDSIMVDFLGVLYHERKSQISGGIWFEYTDTSAIFRIPWFQKTQADVTVQLPEAYIIPVEWKEVIDRLQIHGIQMYPLSHDTAILISSYRFKNPKWQVQPYEGRHVLTQIEYDEINELRRFIAGSMIIPVRQQAGRIIPHMLEPKGNGSFIYWGYFDAIFEQKEYAEAYILEKMALSMLQENPELKAEFEHKRSEDTGFASNPMQILYWFYDRSPYADEKKMMYPIGKIMDENSLRMFSRP